MPMDSKMYRKPAFLFIPILLLLLACPQEALPSPLSTEEERILGQEFLAEIRKYFKLVEDDSTNEYINDLGHYLTKPLATRPFPFRFYIIKNNTMNAFAGPGGHIFVNSGLIEAMDQVDELAAVICHEIAHVSARHIAQRIDQNKKIGLATMAGVLAGALIGGKAAGAIMTGSVAAGLQAQLHYSRNDERQADQLGYKYMDLAGFDPAGMIAALNKISKDHWSGAEKAPPYLMTHPTGPERMANLDSMLSAYTPPLESSVIKRFRENFPFFMTVVTAKCSTQSEAAQVFRGKLRTDPDSAIAHFGLGLTLKEASKYEQAIEHLQKALKAAPESIPVLKNLGEAYQLNGQVQEAIALFEKALKVNDQEKSVMFLLAKSYQDREDFSKAIGLFEKLSLMAPVRDEVFHHLGVSYGRVGKLALAHYYFGIYFGLSAEVEKAKFHFRKAEEFSENDVTLRNKIQKAMKSISASE
jgi:predicted Zn-dependent protease